MKLFVCVQCFWKAMFLQGWLKIFEKTEDNPLLWSLQVFFLYNGKKNCFCFPKPSLQGEHHTHNSVFMVSHSPQWSCPDCRLFSFILSPPLGSAEQLLQHNAEEKKREEAFRDQLHWGSSHLHPSQDRSQIPLSGVSLVTWPLTPGFQGCRSFAKFIFFIVKRSPITQLSI